MNGAMVELFMLSHGDLVLRLLRYINGLMAILVTISLRGLVCELSSRGFRVALWLWLRAKPPVGAVDACRLGPLFPRQPAQPEAALGSAATAFGIRTRPHRLARCRMAILLPLAVLGAKVSQTGVLASPEIIQAGS